MSISLAITLGDLMCKASQPLVRKNVPKRFLVFHVLLLACTTRLYYRCVQSTVVSLACLQYECILVCMLGEHEKQTKWGHAYVKAAP